MTHDIFDDPEARAWAQRAIDELVPIKFALETGMTLLLGKPLILAVVPGRQVPPGLVRAADRIIEFDVGDMSATAQRIQRAVDALVDEGD